MEERKQIRFVVDDAAELHDVQAGTVLLPKPLVHLDVSHNNGTPAHALPAIRNAADLLADKSIKMPPELIHGVLHKGLKGILGSSSKARKTWILLDLALSVASGTKWWNWETTKGRVLVVNFEIPLPFLQERLKALLKTKDMGCLDTGNLDIWTLRGYSESFSTLIPKMLKQIEERRYDLIVIDPIYKGLAGQDENKAGDITTLCNKMEDLAVTSGAAVLYAHHFSKGNQAGKEAIDRFSGSGVFARDADTIVVLSSHEVDNCHSVDLILRNFKEQPPFVVEWDFPVMKMRSDLNADNLKHRPGARKKFKDEDLLALLDKEPLSCSDWEQRAKKDLKMSKATFHRMLPDLESEGKVGKTKPSKKNPEVLYKAL